MTDLKNRFAEMLSSEPGAVDNLDTVLLAGRRMHRRRVAVTSVGATVGTAAVTAAVVVPLSLAGRSSAQGPGPAIIVGAQPTATSTPTAAAACKVFYAIPPTSGPSTLHLNQIFKQAGVSRGAWTVTKIRKAHHGSVEVALCPKSVSASDATSATPEPTPTASSSSSAPAAPRYHYAEAPTAISSRLGAELTDRVHADGLTIVDTQPFAQETATLAPGHPDYFGGNVDVKLASGLADVRVQVNHESTALTPFTDPCPASSCQSSTLPDGSFEEVSRISVSDDGSMIVAVDVHRPDGVEVEAQSANYAFGPEATKVDGDKQPLTVDQLTALAEDPHFTF